MSRRNRNSRRDSSEKSSSSERDHTLFEDPPTIVVSEGAAEDGEMTLQPVQEMETLVTGNSETLYSNNSETLQSDLGVMVLVRGEINSNHHDILRKVFGDVNKFLGNDAAAIALAQQKQRHLLLLNDGFYTNLSSKKLRSTIKSLLDDLRASKEVNVVLLHRSGDQCHRLRSSTTVTDVYIGSNPRECGAYLIHSAAYDRIDGRELFSDSNLLGCYSYSLFVHTDRTVNDREICVPSDFETKSNNNAIVWGVAGIVVVILILIIIFMIFRNRSSSSSYPQMQMSA